MKNKLFLVLILGFLFSTCEKDDICVQNPVTPKLILRFYDKDALINTKSVERFSAIAVGKTDSLFTNSNTDSIAIPLNSLENKTIYTFKKNTASGNLANNEVATFTIEYTSSPDFVSRSCGFREEFTELKFSFDNTKWIDSISVTSLDNINGQTTAHVQVFH